MASKAHDARPKNLINSNFSKTRAKNCDYFHISITFMEIWQLQMVLRTYNSMKNGTTFFKKIV